MQASRENSPVEDKGWEVNLENPLGGSSYSDEYSETVQRLLSNIKRETSRGE